MASSIRGELLDFPRAARISRRGAIAGAALGVAAASLPRLAGAAAPQSQLTWGVHISLAPTWFDPAETPGIITPFMGDVRAARRDAEAAARQHGDAVPGRVVYRRRGQPHL